MVDAWPSLPHTLVQRALARGMTTLAVTGIRPLFGVDVAVASVAPPAPSAGRARTPVHAGAHVVEPPPGGQGRAVLGDLQAVGQVDVRQAPTLTRCVSGSSRIFDPIAVKSNPASASCRRWSPVWPMFALYDRDPVAPACPMTSAGCPDRAHPGVVGEQLGGQVEDGRVGVHTELAQDRGKLRLVDVAGVEVVLDLLEGQGGDGDRGADAFQTRASHRGRRHSARPEAASARLRQIDAEQETPGGVVARQMRPVGAPFTAQDRDRALVATGAEAQVP